MPWTLPQPGPLPQSPQVWHIGTVQPVLGMASRRAGPDPTGSINTGPDAMQPSQPPCAAHHPHSCPRNPEVVGKVTQIPVFQTPPHLRLSPSHPGWQEGPGSHSRGSSSPTHFLDKQSLRGPAWPGPRAKGDPPGWGAQATVRCGRRQAQPAKLPAASVPSVPGTGASCFEGSPRTPGSPGLAGISLRASDGLLPG